MCFLFFFLPLTCLKAEEPLEAQFANAIYPGFSAKLKAESRAFKDIHVQIDQWVFHSIKMAFTLQVLEQFPTSPDECHRVYGSKIKDILTAATQKIDALLSPSTREQRALLIFIQSIGDCGQTSSDQTLYRNHLNIATEFCRQNTDEYCWQLYALLAGEKPSYELSTASLPQQVINILYVLKENPLGTITLFVSIKLLGFIASHVICPRLGFI